MTEVLTPASPGLDLCRVAVRSSRELGEGGVARNIRTREGGHSPGNKLPLDLGILGGGDRGLRDRMSPNRWGNQNCQERELRHDREGQEEHLLGTGQGLEARGQRTEVLN